ncbi:MAG: VOC family protein [Gammaproteobacteria bacterium]|nr:VOC family protein [Gammaproteobacteria bacterium]
MNLNQVTLPCTDFELAVQFYRQLGFKQIVSSPPRYARFECESGATFSLHAAPPEKAGHGVVVYFEVEQLDATVSKLQEAGIQFEALPTDQSWLWREAYLRDPSGNRLCLYFAGDNRRFPPWRLA